MRTKEFSLNKTNNNFFKNQNLSHSQRVDDYLSQTRERKDKKSMHFKEAA